MDLCSQCSYQGLQLVGIQEGRSRNAGIWRCGDYWCVVAGATPAGTAGVECWLHTSLCRDKRNIFPHFASPRHLLLSIASEVLTVDCYVGHALDSSYGAEAVGDWWSECEAVLGRRPSQGKPLLVMVDANCKLGSIRSEAVGVCEADVETAAGAAFHGMLRRQGLMLPATVLGGGPTWCSSANLWHRIDFVGIPQSWSLDGAVAQTGAGVLVATGEREDHRVASLSVLVPDDVGSSR